MKIKSLVLVFIVFVALSAHAQRNYFIGASYVFGHSHTPFVESSIETRLDRERSDGRTQKSFAWSFGFTQKGKLNRRFIFSTFFRHMGRRVSIQVPGFYELNNNWVGPISARNYTFAVSERKFLSKNNKLSLEISPGISLIPSLFSSRREQSIGQSTVTLVTLEDNEVVTFDYTKTFNLHPPRIDLFLNMSTLLVYNFHGVHHVTLGFEGFVGLFDQEIGRAHV